MVDDDAAATGAGSATASATLAKPRATSGDRNLMNTDGFLYLDERLCGSGHVGRLICARRGQEDGVLDSLNRLACEGDGAAVQRQRRERFGRRRRRQHRLE